jgi:hypothetical protein
VSGLLLLALPLSAFLVAAVVVGAVLLARRVPAHDLTAPVVRARRRGSLVAATALALAVALVVAVVAAGAWLPQTGLRRTQLIAVVPLAAAALHAAVLLAGELSWPRPAQRVRSARLAVRTVRADAPRGMVRLFTASCVLAWVVCVVGTVLADGSGRAIEYVDGSASASGSPFPGAFYAGPVALAAVVVVALTWAVLLRVPQRPAVPGADAATDGALRRAAAHRALRVSTSAVLGTTAALLVTGGTAAHGGGRWGEEIGGVVVWHDVGPGPVGNAVAAGAAVSGVLLLLAALAVLLVPVRGVPR